MSWSVEEDIYSDELDQKDFIELPRTQENIIEQKLVFIKEEKVDIQIRLEQDS